MQLFENKSSDACWNAQRNLEGRTHYVDADTLRWHKSRILRTYTSHDGLLFGIVESCAADMHNTKRGFRYVLFDVFGTVIGTRAKLGDLWTNRAKAEKAMFKELDTLDAIEITRSAIEQQEKSFAREIQQSREQLIKIEAKANEGKAA